MLECVEAEVGQAGDVVPGRVHPEHAALIARSVAVVWGPLAGYFAKGRNDLAIIPVETGAATVGLPMAFGIGMGVRKGDKALRDDVDAALARRRDEIGEILDAYGVPRLPVAAPGDKR